jgi:hypothetical protein
MMLVSPFLSTSLVALGGRGTQHGSRVFAEGISGCVGFMVQILRGCVPHCVYCKCLTWCVACLDTGSVGVFVVQLTDVDPDYGKAPTAQLADKLPESGRAGEVFDTTREMLLETQVGLPCLHAHALMEPLDTCLYAHL